MIAFLFSKANQVGGNDILYWWSQRTKPNVSANVLDYFGTVYVHANMFQKNVKLYQLAFHPFPRDDAMPFPQSSSEATAVLVLRIHSRLGLEEPLDNPDMAVESCEVQRRRASGAAGGVRNLGHLKIGVPLKLALNLRNIVVLRCLEVIELVVLLKPCQPCRESNDLDPPWNRRSKTSPTRKMSFFESKTSWRKRYTM